CCNQLRCPCPKHRHIRRLAVVREPTTPSERTYSTIPKSKPSGSARGIMLQQRGRARWRFEERSSPSTQRAEVALTWVSPRGACQNCGAARGPRRRTTLALDDMFAHAVLVHAEFDDKVLDEIHRLRRDSHGNLLALRAGHELPQMTVLLDHLDCPD